MGTIQVELTDLSASELARQIASRQMSATEVVKAHIKQIEQRDPRVHAVVVPLFDEALAEAAKADGMSAEGRPLHGVPVTVKECFHVKGTASTVGLDKRRDHRADSDAELVARLKAAGAIVIAKTNVPQLLIYVEADNPLYGRTNNPWNLARSPGGSRGLESAGCTVSEFSPPDIMEALQVFYGLFTADGGKAFKRWLRHSTVDTRIKDLMTLGSIPNPLRPAVARLYGLRGQRRIAQLLGWSGKRSKAETAALVVRRDAYRQRFLAALGDIDVLICPPAAVPAVTHGATKQ